MLLPIGYYIQNVKRGEKTMNKLTMKVCAGFFAVDSIILFFISFPCYSQNKQKKKKYSNLYFFFYIIFSRIKYDKIKEKRKEV